VIAESSSRLSAGSYMSLAPVSVFDGHSVCANKYLVKAIYKINFTAHNHHVVKTYRCKKMKLQVMAQRLTEMGYTQWQIAEMCEVRGATANQSTIHRILKGVDPSYTLGDALRQVYMDVCENNRGAA